MMQRIYIYFALKHFRRKLKEAENKYNSVVKFQDRVNTKRKIILYQKVVADLHLNK
jgi:hypothetical protein